MKMNLVNMKVLLVYGAQAILIYPVEWHGD